MQNIIKIYNNIILHVFHLPFVGFEAFQSSGRLCNLSIQSEFNASVCVPFFFLHLTERVIAVKCAGVINVVQY